MPFLDCHNHTAEWSDGRQSIEQVLERARAEGVRVGLSDHAGLGDYLNSEDRLLAYADFLSQYPVARGYEMDLGRSFGVSQSVRGRFDYVIGSVHGLPDAMGERRSFSHLLDWTRGKRPDWDPRAEFGDLDALLRRHLGLLEREFSERRYDILGHCTVLPPLATNPDPEEAFPAWWEDALVETLKKHGVAMEISNRWRTPTRRLMAKAVKAGLRFSFGSDGHEPARTCVLEYPKALATENGIAPERIFDVTRLSAS